MPIDLSAVDWAYVGILSLLAFVTALLGSLIAFRNRFVGAIIAGILFAVGFIFWTYYPHPTVPGPTRLSDTASASTSEAAAPAPPASRPANPVTTLSTAPPNPAQPPAQPSGPASSGGKQ